MPRDLHDLLTPAARQMLLELERDFRERLLLGAADAASQVTPELRELSVADLARSYEQLQPDAVRSRRSLVERLLDVYAVGGVVLGFGGFVFAMVLQGRDGASSDTQMLAYVAVATGFTVLTFSWVMRRSRRVQRLIDRVSRMDTTRGATVHFDDEAALIRAWSELEVALRESAAQRLGESAAQRPVSQLIDVLQKSGTLSTEDVISLRHFAQIRNSLVHGRQSGPRDLAGIVADLRAFTHRFNVTSAV